LKICCVCGARPNFMKISAVIAAAEPQPELECVLVHTGQHYDERMSKLMFKDLGLPRPDFNLEVGSASHAVQTAEVMVRFEPVLVDLQPDLVLVVGDVNSSLACSLVAVKLGVPVGHVEAGLRSFDRGMPEELNRVATDALSDLLFVSEASGVDNLRREGAPQDNVFFVGNVMIDTLLRNRHRAEESRVLERVGVEPGDYAVLTLHRPSNVDDPATLGGLIDALEEISLRFPVVFPVHPRTVQRLDELGLRERLHGIPGIRLIEPQGYLDFLKLMADARLVLTDSGGIQEEATVLRVPCLTLRRNTERPATLESGWNRLVGTDRREVLAGFEAVIGTPTGASTAPELWDGRAGERIARGLIELGVPGLRRLQAARGIAPSSGPGPLPD